MFRIGTLKFISARREGESTEPERSLYCENDNGQIKKRELIFEERECTSNYGEGY